MPVVKSLSLSAWAALKLQTGLSHSSGGWKSQIRVLVDSAHGEGPLPGHLLAVSSPFLLSLPPLYNPTMEAPPS